MGQLHSQKVHFRARARFCKAHEPGRRRLDDAMILAHSVHCTECAKINSGFAARYLPRAALQKICAASERHRQSISTCEGRCRTNVPSARIVVPSSAATGLSPVVHPPSRPMDLKSPHRASVETCWQTRHGEHVAENWSLRLKEERVRHAGRPSCYGNDLIRPRSLSVSRHMIHAHRR